ncbi:hypothetical protein Ahia01_001207300, partial [Argonauta hians]
MQRKKHLQACQVKEEMKNELVDEETSNILAEANQTIFERDAEIKQFNELIAGAKSHAVKGIQMKEKKLIEEQHIAEEVRLRKLMQDDCEVNLKYQDNVQKQRKKLRTAIAEEIKRQIKQREWDKLMKLEAKEQENARMLKRFEEMIAEDIRAEELKREKQRETNAVMEANRALMMEHKLKKQKEEELEDQRILQFQNNKMEREAAYEREQKRLKYEKDQEISKMRKEQERVLDNKAEKLAMMVKRENARMEKEWRQKELDEAKKKADNDAYLIEYRIQQKLHKENNMAKEVAKNREEFESILRAQQAAMAKDKKEEAAAKERAKELIRDIQEQVRFKESEKIAERKASFEEGKRLREEQYYHKLKVRDCKAKKLEEIYKTDIPRRFLNKLEHNMKQTEKELEYLRKLMEGTWETSGKAPFL